MGKTGEHGGTHKNTLSLEQFRQSLESDALVRCEQQEKTIKELTVALTGLRNIRKECTDREKEIAQLQNRCYVLSAGVMCCHCGFSDTCEHSPIGQFQKKMFGGNN